MVAKLRPQFIHQLKTGQFQRKLQTKLVRLWKLEIEKIDHFNVVSNLDDNAVQFQLLKSCTKTYSQFKQWITHYQIILTADERLVFQVIAGQISNQIDHQFRCLLDNPIVPMADRLTGLKIIIGYLKDGIMPGAIGTNYATNIKIIIQQFTNEFYQLLTKGCVELGPAHQSQ